MVIGDFCMAPILHSGARTAEGEGMGDKKDERRVVKAPADVPVRGTQVRRGDIEPYTALKWVGTLFKSAAVFLAVAVVAEFIAGLRMEGTAALPIVLGELARTAVLAVVLWGMGDLVRLLVHVGHDVRAQRIMLSRVAFRLKRDAQASMAAESALRDDTPPEDRIEPL